MSVLLSVILKIGYFYHLLMLSVPTKDKSKPIDRDIQKVLDLCIVEFLAVTDTKDSKLARYYVQKAKMDVNQAISFYYEDIS